MAWRIADIQIHSGVSSRGLWWGAHGRYMFQFELARHRPSSVDFIIQGRLEDTDGAGVASKSELCNVV